MKKTQAAKDNEKEEEKIKEQKENIKEEKDYGILPRRDLKKNLGCGG